MRSWADGRFIILTDIRITPIYNPHSSGKGRVKSSFFLTPKVYATLIVILPTVLDVAPCQRFKDIWRNVNVF